MDRDGLVHLCGVCVRVYTTAGYAHLADAHLVEAAERVGTLLAQAMGYGAEPQEAKRTGCVSI